MYMLDTNIVSDMIRRPNGVAARRFNQIGQHNIAISIIVAAELRFGVLNSESTTFTGKVNDLLGRLEILPLKQDADMRYAEIRSQLERGGTPISANDIFIAAHAMELARTLVTDNTGEFSRVQGLKLENWLR